MPRNETQFLFVYIVTNINGVSRDTIKFYDFFLTTVQSHGWQWILEFDLFVIFVILITNSATKRLRRANQK